VVAARWQPALSRRGLERAPEQTGAHV
jgi:hypothetical protein